MTKKLRITESENPRTADIDRLDTETALSLINDEDSFIAGAVRKCIPTIAQFLEELVPRLKAGGRLIYVGTGTSGRLGVLDASEIPPTFGVQYGKIIGVIAGGYDALHKAVEASEDDHSAGANDLIEIGLRAEDAVIGIAASGRTPYTIGAVTHANEVGCLTACITCAPDSEITKLVDYSIEAEVGAEVIAGSTRMKSGTAQKLILNMISTMSMIRLGYVSGNRMTNVRPSNEKLRDRSIRILMSETSLDEESARALFTSSDADLKVAIVIAKTGVAKETAIEALQGSDYVISDAIAALRKD
jgi:N-acetylmuramic acid 6-phosphate etherase